MKVYQNQLDAAELLVQNITKHHHINLGLFAQMQSGKTGVYSTVLKLFANESLAKYKYVVFTPIALTEVVDQIEKDVSAIIQGIPNVDYYSNPDLNGEKSDKLFEKYKNCNLFIIIDESHVATGNNTNISKFLKKLGIKENRLDLGRENTILLTVSATDFESIHKNVTKIVRLEPGEGYYGVREMIKAKKVFRSRPILNGNKLGDVFQEKLEYFYDIPKYLLVRYNGKKDIRKYIQKNEYGKYFKIKVIDQTSGLILKEEVKEKPTQPTILLLKQMGRVGIQLDTTHVGMVWDSPESNTDTAVQALVGRCCGYGKEKDGVLIGADIDQIQNYANYLNGLDSPLKSQHFKKAIELDQYHVPVKINYNGNVENLTGPALDSYFAKTVDEFKVLLEELGSPTRRSNLVKNTSRNDKAGLEEAIKNNVGYAQGFKPDDKWGYFYNSNTIYLSVKRDSPVKTVISKISEKSRHFEHEEGYQ